jgi:hypothetical protein
MALPLRLPKDQMETRWKSSLDPVLANPLNSMSVLKDISLTTGVNVINHKLQQTLQGWIITDINGAAQIYRSAPLNNLTLTLTSDANVVISLAVY